MPSGFGAESAPDLYRQLADAFRGAPEVPSRDGPTLELEGPTVAWLREPQKRMPLVPGREGNPWVTLAEWPWLVAGHNDVAWLEPYLPRAKDFSDDGESWRAGYGPRLRAWCAAVPAGPDQLPDMRVTDQLHEVVEALRAKPDSRQAVISFWDPTAEWMAMEKGTRDVPCTDFLQAWVREGRLNLHVVMRSNDLIWGLSGVNLYNWTMLQELLAACLDVELGYYAHTATSLHVYHRHRGRLDKMADTEPPPYPPCGPALSKTTLARYTEECRTALHVVKDYRGRGLEALPDPMSASPTWRWRSGGVVNGLSPEVRDWCRFMLLHPYLQERQAPWGALLRSIGRNDWWLAALEYLSRTARLSPKRVDAALEDRISSPGLLLGSTPGGRRVEAERYRAYVLGLDPATLKEKGMRRGLERGKQEGLPL